MGPLDNNGLDTLLPSQREHLLSRMFKGDGDIDVSLVGKSSAAFPFFPAKSEIPARP